MKNKIYNIHPLSVTKRNPYYQKESLKMDIKDIIKHQESTRLHNHLAALMFRIKQFDEIITIKWIKYDIYGDKGWGGCIEKFDMRYCIYVEDVNGFYDLIPVDVSELSDGENNKVINHICINQLLQRVFDQNGIKCPYSYLLTLTSIYGLVNDARHLLELKRDNRISDFEFQYCLKDRFNGYNVRRYHRW